MTDRKRNLLTCLALAIITLAVYASALRNDFVNYDDQQYITENRHVQDGLTWAGLRWAFQSGYASNWHPLTWISHQLDCQLYGLNPVGHHLTSVLLHAANTVLLFLALLRFTGARGRSAVAAALFALHPLHVESVAWVAERKDVLAAFFWLLTMHAYTWYAAKPGVGRYLITLGLLGLGLMAKPMVVTLPFVLLLMDYWPLARIAKSKPEKDGAFAASKNPRIPWQQLLLEKIPFLGLTALACGLTVWAQRGAHSIVSLQGLPLWNRILHVAIAYAHYLKVMFLPWHLAAYYPFPAETAVTKAGMAALLLIMISVLMIRSAPRRPYLLVGWLWYLGTLVPVIGFVQVGDQAWADRYTYIPLIGPFIMLVWGIADGIAGWEGSGVRSRWLGRTTEIALPLLAGAIFSCLTVAQISTWRNTRTLFEQAVRVTPANSKGLSVLGSLLAKEGKLDQAMALYDEALRYKPDDPEAHFFRASALEAQGKLDEAIGEYQRALWFKPFQGKTEFFLGVALAKQKHFDEAIGHYLEALKIDPELAVAHNNLARLYHSQGKFAQAEEQYSAALRYDPSLVPARNNLGIVLIQAGKLAEGTEELREALRLNPGNAEAEFNLATALNQQGLWTEAAEIFARRMTPATTDPNAHYQFGLALEHTGKTREAMGKLARALILQPDFPDALNELSWILATDPRAEFRNGTEAIHMAERANELSGNGKPAYLKTLAAAYAEAGRFADAISTAEKAHTLAGKEGKKEITLQCQKLLDAALAGQPWREPATLR